MITVRENASECRQAKGRFQPTHWSIVLAAGSHSEQAQAALAKLCEAYWHPIYAHIRTFGLKPEDAQDLTQEFFARFLAKGYVREITPDKGRFRSCLLTALKGFMANEWHRANCRKRGGGIRFVSMDDDNYDQDCGLGLADNRTPDKVFEQTWAITVLEQVIRRLRNEWTASGKGQEFDRLKVFLTGEESATAPRELARKLGMSEGTLRVTIHRLRQRYRQLLRLEIAHTVSSPDEIEEEIQHLLRSLTL